MTAEPPPHINDPGWVAGEYTDPARLAGRAAFWTDRVGPQPQELALERVLALRPRRVLEVGCGPGEFAQSLSAAGISVVATDASPQMVRRAAARGLDARVADVQALPFADDDFDVAVANFMLYHLPDLNRGLAELARVLAPAATLVATTNGERKLAEMWDLVGRPAEPAVFSSENGAGALGRHFASVTRIDVIEPFTVTERAMHEYIAHTRFAALVDNLPQLPEGLTVTAISSVFVATAAR